MSGGRKIRCAIYARTSTEEGLSQEFNSLDAQIEACRAYIASQAGEGWVCHKQAFVDGGYSGGSLERPALKQLLSALTAQEIDVIVVYKVDRLTRSLSDFARIVEKLDAAGASFVSITQSFNTTTSMGRLTLNVLLSFAQFEREVTAERIRDKIAASKAKGIYMGGTPPLGYDIQNRHLVVNEEEAERVRLIFRRYLELGSIEELTADLRARGVLSKQWTSKNGCQHVGKPIWRGAVAYILANPLYRGVIAHKNKTYPGRHEAIIDDELWNAVQARRGTVKAKSDRAPRQIEGHLLAGRVMDDIGNAMRLRATRKGGRLYRYYVSAALLGGDGVPGSLGRISAGALDRTTLQVIAPVLAQTWRRGENQQERGLSALKRVEVSAQKLRLVLRAEAVDAGAASDASTGGIRNGADIVFERQVTLARPRNATTIIGVERSAARVDRVLVRAVALARHWADQLESGAVRSVVDLAAAEKRCLHYTNRLLPLAYLAPDLVEMVLAGRQPRGLTLSALLAKPLPLDWDAQRALLRRIA